MVIFGSTFCQPIESFIGYMSAHVHACYDPLEYKDVYVNFLKAALSIILQSQSNGSK